MFDVDAAADRLKACRTTSEIKAFRSGLSHEQAQAVIRRLAPVDRAAVLLCMHMGGVTGRGAWARTDDATIVVLPSGEPSD